MLRRAAEIEGRSLTDFVVAAASAAARHTIAEAEVLHLSGESAGPNYPRPYFNSCTSGFRPLVWPP